jgi:hypothetical protein
MNSDKDGLGFIKGAKNNSCQNNASHLKDKDKDEIKEEEKKSPENYVQTN